MAAYKSNAKNFLKETQKVAEVASEEIALRVRDKAQQILDARTDGTGSLAASTYVYESKRKDGSYIVYAHGDMDYLPKSLGKPRKLRARKRRLQTTPGRFYAIFVEFGTSKMRAVPFLRPALRGQGKHLLSAFKKHYKRRIESQKIRGG